MRWQKRTVTGWGRSSQATVAACRPERLADIRRALLDVGAEGIVAFAGGRSYGDAALNDGGRALLTPRLNRLLSFDPDSGELAAEPGVTFADILRTFLPRGFIMPVTPGTGFATLGGAVAMDVHGKNHDWAGSFGDHLLWIDLLLPSGEVVRTSPEQRPALFAATVGGLGLTGIVVALAFRLMKAPSPAVSVRQTRTGDLDETMALIARHRDSATFSVAWVDALAGGRRLGRGIVEIAEPARDGAAIPPPERRRRVPFDLPGWLLNPLSVAAFNAFYWRHVPREGQSKIMAYEKFLYPLDSILDWNRIYGRRGLYQFQAVIPEESSAAGIRALLSTASRSHAASFLSVLKTMGRAGRGYLSFARPGFTLALDFPRGRRIDGLLDELERVALDHGGRVYLAKDARLSRQGFAAMYPRADEFRRVLAEIDPGGRMSSNMARRLGLRGGAS
jgi:decaprenylphospho-beta-D-ribofuranose 2-oxidase